MEDCLFCRIIAGEIPSSKVYEDEFTYAFRDINPQTREHVLVVPKQHIANLSENDKLTDEQLSACLRSCAKVAKLLGIDQTGYRVISNCGDHACQTVKHLHFHVLGGEQMRGEMA